MYGVTESERGLVAGRRDTVGRDERHLLHRTGTALRRGVAGGTRGAGIQRPQTIFPAQRRVEREGALIERRLQLPGDTRQRRDRGARRVGLARARYEREPQERKPHAAEASAAFSLALRARGLGQLPRGAQRDDEGL